MQKPSAESFAVEMGLWLGSICNPTDDWLWERLHGHDRYLTVPWHSPKELPPVKCDQKLGTNTLCYFGQFSQSRILLVLFLLNLSLGKIGGRQIAPDKPVQTCPCANHGRHLYRTQCVNCTWSPEDFHPLPISSSCVSSTPADLQKKGFSVWIVVCTFCYVTPSIIEMGQEGGGGRDLFRRQSAVHKTFTWMHAAFSLMSTSSHRLFLQSHLFLHGLSWYLFHFRSQVLGLFVFLRLFQNTINCYSFIRTAKVTWRRANILGEGPKWTGCCLVIKSWILVWSKSIHDFGNFSHNGAFWQSQTQSNPDSCCFVAWIHCTYNSDGLPWKRLRVSNPKDILPFE